VERENMEKIVIAAVIATTASVAPMPLQFL